MNTNKTWIAGLLAVVLFATALGTLSVSGAADTSGTASATVPSTAGISLNISSVNFGTVTLGQTYNTTVSPSPFTVQNDGSVNVNVTVNATQLWTRDASASSDYQFKCQNVTGGRNLSCPSGSQTSWTNVPIGSAASVLVIANLPFADTGDTTGTGIQITVPSDEPQGAKSSTVYFWGQAA